MILLLLLVICVLGLIFSAVYLLLAGGDGRWIPWAHTAAIWFALLLVLLGYRYPALLVMR